MDAGATFSTPIKLAGNMDEFSEGDLFYLDSLGLLLTLENAGQLYFSRSTDLGISFTDTVRIDSQRLFNSPSVVAYLDGNVYVAAVSSIRDGQSAAIFYSRIDLLTGVEEHASIELPDRFVLFQNYPNPLNPSTTISYALPAQSYVTLKVFNMLGQEIATLVHGIESPGSKSVRFVGSGLPSGAYFYRLQAESYTSTKMLMIVK
jgi:hypothetical protein